MPTTSTPAGEVLAASPLVTISNGLIVASIAPPDLKHGFYRGIRFDQAGVVTSLTFKGRHFYAPWFFTGPGFLMDEGPTRSLVETTIGMVIESGGAGE